MVMPISEVLMRKRISVSIPSVLLALTLLVLACLHGLLHIMVGLGLSIKGAFEGLLLLLWGLAALTSVLAVVLVLVRPRWTAWCVLALAYSLSTAMITIDSRQTALENRERNQRLAPRRLAENRLLIESALIRADCADGVTLTLNRRDFSDGDAVMSVSEIPADRTRQHDLLVVLNNRWADHLVRNFSNDRPFLESYKSQGSRSCQHKIDAMLKQLDLFARSKT